MRDYELELKLQAALDRGDNVWVIGDVHGFFQSMVELCESLDLSEGDWVVFLGDLIDRGPNGFGVVHEVMNNPRFTSVKGNHEDMMVQQFTMEKIRHPDMDVMLWMRNGGNTTVASYIEATRNEEGEMDDVALEECAALHTAWMAQLPTHLVLDRWRLVHAGYRPNHDLEQQTSEDLLWIRRAFHAATQPIDPVRTIVFGHTPTVALPGHTKEEWGHVWHSEVRLKDERPAATGLDTCLYQGPLDRRVLSAMNLRTGRVVQQHRVEA